MHRAEQVGAEVRLAEAAGGAAHAGVEGAAAAGSRGTRRSACRCRRRRCRRRRARSARGSARPCGPCPSGRVCHWYQTSVRSPLERQVAAWPGARGRRRRRSSRSASSSSPRSGARRSGRRRTPCPARTRRRRRCRGSRRRPRCNASRAASCSSLSRSPAVFRKTIARYCARLAAVMSAASPVAVDLEVVARADRLDRVDAGLSRGVARRAVEEEHLAGAASWALRRPPRGEQRAPAPGARPHASARHAACAAAGRRSASRCPSVHRLLPCPSMMSSAFIGCPRQDDLGAGRATAPSAPRMRSVKRGGDAALRARERPRHRA